MLKSNIYVIWIFIAFLFELKKMYVFKIAFLGQKNVHFVLNIHLDDENCFWHFWNIFIYFQDFFSVRRNYFKK